MCKWALMVSHFILSLMNNFNKTEAAIFVTLGLRTADLSIYSDYVSTDVVYLVLRGLIMLPELHHCVLNMLAISDIWLFGFGFGIGLKIEFGSCARVCHFDNLWWTTSNQRKKLIVFPCKLYLLRNFPFIQINF